MNLKVVITKTSRGDQDYVQIMSDDCVSVNVVFVADAIAVEDARKPADKALDALRSAAVAYQQSEAGLFTESYKRIALSRSAEIVLKRALAYARSRA